MSKHGRGEAKAYSEKDGSRERGASGAYAEHDNTKVSTQMCSNWPFFSLFPDCLRNDRSVNRDHILSTRP